MKKELCIFSAVAVLCLAGCGSTSEKEVLSTSEVIESTEEESSEVISTEEETTSEEVEKKAKKTSKSNIEASDDIYSFQITINDELYQFPMTYEDFTAYGWEYDPGSYDDAIELAPNQYSPFEKFKKDGLQINGVVANLGMNTVSIEECIICGVSIEKFYFDKENSNPKVELPGGIVRGESTLDDVKAAYGDPSSDYDGDLYTMLEYDLDYDQEVKLYVDKDTGTLGNIDIRNLVPIESEGADTESAEISDEVPDVVSKYEAPTSLKGDLEEFVFELDGDLYRLPAPVCEFEKNGWKVIDDDSDMVIKGKSYGWVTMMKNNQKFHTIVNNYDGNATSVNNCFISKVEASEYGADLSMKLPNGIETGMSKKDLDKIISGISDVVTDEDDTFFYYDIVLLDSELERVSIKVNKESNKITIIEISHYDAEKDFMSR